MGKFNTHGGYFAPNGYFRVDEGGSHEENPNGGVQVGVDQNGVPNMLEEGEPVYNDYVFSDNITAEEDILEKHNIPVKYAGKLYSKIADAFVDEAEERPNDPISNNGLNAMLLRLADAQEEQKAIQQQKELEDELANMSPEELDQLEAMLANQQAVEQEQAAQAQAMEEQQAISPEEQMMAQQQMVQPEMQQPMMACGGKMTRKYAPGGLLTDPPTRTIVTPQRDNTATVFTGTSTGLPVEEPLPQHQLQPGLIDIISDATSIKTPYVGGLGALDYAVGPGMLRYARGVKGAQVLKAMDEAYKTANTASKVTKASKTAKKAKAAKDMTTWQKIRYTAERPLGWGLAGTAIGAGTVAPNYVEIRRDTKEATKNPFNKPNAVQYIDDSDMFNFDYAEGGQINKFAYGGPDDPPQYINPSYYSGQVPYMNPLMRGTLYKQPNGISAIQRNRSSYGIRGMVPMLPSDKGRRWYTYTPGDVVDWNAAVSGSDKARIYDGTEYINTIPFVYGYGDKPVAEKLPDVRNNNIRRKAVLDPLIDWKLVQDEADNGVHNYWRSIYTPIKQVDRVTDPYFDYSSQKVLSNNMDSGLKIEPMLPSKKTMRKYNRMQREANAVEEDETLPTWMRYAGIANAAGDMLWNLAQKPDKYRIPRYNPVLPEGQMNLIDPVFNPIDENMAVNDLLAANAGTTYGLRNSGLGPSAGAALLAADYNAGKNMGAARTQVWDANNQRRNQVIAQRNANAQALGNFNYGINRERAQILNDAELRNMQNSILRQRLNNAAEQEKWNAFRDSKEALAQGLSGIGRENFALNQINLNEALDYLAKNGYDVTYKGKKVACGGKISRKK